MLPTFPWGEAASLLAHMTANLTTIYSGDGQRKEPPKVPLPMLALNPMVQVGSAV